MKNSALPFVVIFAGIVLFSSRAGAGPLVERRTPFNEADFAGTNRSGAGSVVGHAFVTLTDRSMRTGKNEVVVLLPVNAYTRETIERRYIGGENLVSGDPRYDKYVRSATMDNQGNFAFHGIPPGEYYVGTDVRWSNTYFMNDSDGILQKNTVPHMTMIYARISVRNGQRVNVTNWSQSRSKVL